MLELMICSPVDSSREHEKLRGIANYIQGQGYSLPADIQYVDTRWEVPVVLPLRDCLAQELRLLCEFDR